MKKPLSANILPVHYIVKRFALSILLFLCIVSPVISQPIGFIDQEYLSNWNQAVGMTFDNNGRMFVWEKGGHVYIVENGIKNPSPLIDIEEEVGNWADYGLVGFALDPDFLSNGYIYLLYVVDRHHLLNFGTPSYNPITNEYFNATLGRLTRYTAGYSTNFTTVDYNSRTVLMGITPGTGPPILSGTHGVGSLVFATDGTLMVSIGDGATPSVIPVDEGGLGYSAQGLIDGIIGPSEDVGAYRCQMLTSLSGKILRIDKNTGNGIPSNPFFEASNPGSVQSRVWSLGVRNPYRLTIKPNTGSQLVSDGDPGTFYFGDVGMITKEELNVANGPGQNFGWPKYEGMTYEPGFNNPSYAPSTHKLPAADWRNGSTARASVGGVIYNIGSTQVPGPSFDGTSSTGGVWYTGDDFPVEYKNTYFHADFGTHWIHNFEFDTNDELTKVNSFVDENGPVAFLTSHPTEGGLLYINYADNSIHRITHSLTGKILEQNAEIEGLKIERQEIVIYTGSIMVILSFLLGFGLYKRYKYVQRTKKIIEIEKDKSEQLLLNILPAETAKEFEENGLATPRQYDSVSVLFTDFKNFTKLTKSLSSQDLVNQLNTHFSTFDDIIEKYGLEKIKTIGDTYMCAGGIPMANDTHAVSTIKAGLAIQAYMNESNWRRMDRGPAQWDLRVGIHTGPVVAGVVGKKKYAYDIWGDTVNIASRMESNGEGGMVNISAETYAHVKNLFNCTHRGKIEAKKKSKIDMYFVESEISEKKMKRTSCNAVNGSINNKWKERDMKTGKITAMIILIIGIGLLAVSLLSDVIGVGKYPYFGFKQTIGAIVGVVITAVGVFLGCNAKDPLSGQPD